MDLLSDKEIIELTGYKKASLQIDWLKKNKIPFLIAKTNCPKVHKDALAFRMGAPVQNSNVLFNSQKPRPKFENIKKSKKQKAYP